MDSHGRSRATDESSAGTPRLPKVIRRSNPTATRQPGVIHLLELYSIKEAQSRLGWSDSALRAAKRRGLQLLTCGKRRYVTGREIVRFLQHQQALSTNTTP
jgi:hypothetical protein